jgi:hypothetical protein
MSWKSLYKNLLKVDKNICLRTSPITDSNKVEREIQRDKQTLSLHQIKIKTLALYFVVLTTR